MTREELNSVFGAAISLKEGQRAVLQFQDDRSAECARVQLYQYKRKYMQLWSKSTDELFFSKETRDGSCLLVIEKKKRGFSFFIEENGVFKETPLIIKEEIPLEKEFSFEEVEKPVLRQFTEEEARDFLLECKALSFTEEEIEESFKTTCPEFSKEKWKELEK